MNLRQITRSTHGATAIEYAIIAGLIGLGLVGALAATRGSLTGVYGTAATQMGSAGTPAAPAAPAYTPPYSDSPRASYWEAKTPVGPPIRTVSGVTIRTTWTYTDGSQATYVENAASPRAYGVIVQDSAAKQTAQSFFDTVNGSTARFPTYSEVKNYADSDFSVLIRSETADRQKNQIVNSNITQTDIYDCSSGCRTLTNQSPSNAFQSANMNTFYDYGYFGNIRP